MRKGLSAVFVLPALLMTGCQQSKVPDDNGGTSVEEGSGACTTPDYHSYDTVKIGNDIYTYDILRQPCDSLPTVKDELGEVKDNTIRLTLTRNGRTYCDHTFTKRTFQSGMDASFYENSVLDGIRYVGAEAGNGLTFSLAVSEPNSDMSIPFSLTVADDGSFSFSKEEVMDVGQLDE